MKRGLGVVLAVVLLPKVALAYEVLGSVWQNAANGVNYCPVSNSTDANTTAKKNQFLTAVINAAEAWGDDLNLGAPCSALNVVNATGTNACSGTPSEGSNKPWVFWVQNWSSLDGLGPSTIGVTPWVSSGSRIVQAKIMFNDQNYTWTTTNSNVQTDVQSIAVHEFGHFFGLDHYDEYSQTKRNQCTNNATYPAVMCAYYDSGVSRVLTADDIQGICYLYPDAGALGSACSAAGQCDSNSCHPSGYCTQACGSCPTGYSCTSNLCERDVPPPSCQPCPGITCDSNSLCVGASGGAVCTRACSSGSPCPSGYGCVALDGGSSACYPHANTCSSSGPGAGAACGAGASCAFGNVCLNDGTANGSCYATCNVAGDCTQDEDCISLGQGLKYCDVVPDCGECGGLACGEDSVCLSVDEGGMCAPDCSTNTDCPRQFYCASLQGGGGACYPLANSCKNTGPGPGQPCQSGACRFGNLCISNICYTACRVDGDCASGKSCESTGEVGVGYCENATEVCDCDDTGSCDAGCTCDVDCAGIDCSCDTTTACDPDCGCDAECLACECDVSTACDPDCSECDPECAVGGCSCGPQQSGGSENLLGMGLGLLLLMLQGRRRRVR